MLEFENREVVNEFLEETLDGFETIENTLVHLEDEPDNLDLINTIFRPIHSLKGNSSYFGLFKVKTLTHTLENLLDEARKENIKITSEIISILLSSIDYLKEMIERVENEGEEVVDEESYENKINIIEEILTKQDKLFSISSKVKTQIINLFKQIQDDSNDNIKNEIKNILTVFEIENSEQKNDNKIKNKVIDKLIKYFTDPFPSGEANDDDIEKINNLIDNIKIKNKQEYVIELYEKFKDDFETFAFSGVGIDEVGQEILLESLTELINIAEFEKDEFSEKTEKTTEKVDDNPEEKTKKIVKNDDSTKNAKSKIEATIRIKEHSLDEFLNTVAELLSIEELFNFLSHEIEKYSLDLSSTFRHHLDEFSRISSKLRNGIMDIRKVEASILLQKVPRLVRDIITDSNKEIKVKTIGENIKIDKSYIELLDSPIVHMVRNAADHGIEHKEERKKAGKDISGNIEVSIIENEKNLILKVADNGKGLDLDALRLKAIEKGFIQQTQELKESDIVNLLFQSGVSTATKVTDVSGRGVGMDVVKTAIESVNGKINVKTKPGEGSEFSIELPKNVSTKINEVYLIKSFEDEIYALPLKLIEEAFTVSPEELFSVANQGQVLIRRDNVLSVLVLDELFGGKGKTFLEESRGSNGNIPFIYVNFPGKPIALCIKEIIGVQTIVVKNINGVYLNKKIFEGGATLANGKIALLIKPEYLLNFSTIITN